MSAISLTKPISFTRKSTAASGAKATAVANGLGGVPRANLLPPSVLAARKARQDVRRILLALIVTVVLALAASGVSAVRAAGAAAQLDAERARTNALLAQQAEFGEVSALEASIDRLNSARVTLGATDVDWAAYLTGIRATLPEGVVLTGATVSTITAGAPAAVDADGNPVADAGYVATLQLTVGSADLASVPSWADRLAALPAVVDATLLSVTQGDAGYVSVVSLGVDEQIYSGLYAEKSSE